MVKHIRLRMLIKLYRLFQTELDTTTLVFTLYFLRKSLPLSQSWGVSFCLEQSVHLIYLAIVRSVLWWRCDSGWRWEWWPDPQRHVDPDPGDLSPTPAANTDSDTHQWSHPHTGTTQGWQAHCSGYVRTSWVQREFQLTVKI